MSGFDETFDFVAVGSGGGSMCASLVMRCAGKSAVILEKTDLVGGTTARAGGVMWIPNNPFMRRDGIEDSSEKALAYLNAAIGDARDSPGATPARRRSYVTEAPRMVEFLLSQGVKLTRASYWPDYYDELPGGSVPGRTVVAELFDANDLGAWKGRLRPNVLPLPGMLEDIMKLQTIKLSWKTKLLAAKIGLRAIGAKLTGRHWVTGGAALQGRMLQAVLKHGIDIRTDSPVSELIVEEGSVTGVLTVKNGRPWRVGARLGVLVNAGGFSHNQAMRDKYQPGSQTKWSMAMRPDQGEMIEEMMRRGAAIAQMEEFVGYQHTIPPGSENSDIKPPAQSMTAKPHAILVDQSGVRYLNEGGSYMAYCKAMFERHKTVPAVPSWAILDSQYLRRYMLAGTMPGSKKPQRWYDERYLRSGDTIEELAAQLNIKPQTLRATVDRFNGFVASGKDEDFHRGARAYDRWLGDPYHKPSATLGSISEGPFYAVPVVPGDVGTYGGVVTDEFARVLREDGSVISGLYATGISTASVMGRVYPGAGCSIGPAFTFGYIAAKHAAGATPGAAQ
jgi:3-oxosteroid 1-dehydrogenase